MNFISSDALPCDRQLFFGPLGPDETFRVFNKTRFRFEDMAVAAGVFPSLSQARKNGWQGPIPLGFGSRKAGKKMLFWFNSMDNSLE